MTARHDKATELAATVREALDSLERIGGGWYGIKPTRAALDALEALATGKATEGRTEAAAVDQAIADLAEAAEGWPTPNKYTAALRVLADAVEELRLSLYSRDILLSLANGRLEAAEAERDRLKAAMHPHTVAFVLENVRLARQVADLTALLQWYDDHADGDGNYDGEMWGNLRVLDPAAARSRDPQEPQT